MQPSWGGGGGGGGGKGLGGAGGEGRIKGGGDQSERWDSEGTSAPSTSGKVMEVQFYKSSGQELFLWVHVNVPCLNYPEDTYMRHELP